MALSGNTVLEVRLTGSDTNGGGFVTGASGTNHSLQDSPQYSVTDGVTAGTTTITSATANFGTDVVGNIMYVQGGTGSVTAGWYQITARTNSTTITVDRSTGLTAGTGVTLHIGGALASPGQAAAIATVSFMTVFIKYNASPYVITSASTNIAAGCVSGTANTAYIGYDTTRLAYNMDVNRPTIQLQAGVTSATMFGNLNSYYLIQTMILDANSQTGSRCTQQSGEVFNVKGMNGVSGGITRNSASRALFCEVTGCAAVPLNADYAYFCVAHDNTLTSPSNQGSIQGGINIGCLAYNNNCDGFAQSGGYMLNCTAYSNDGAGFNCHNSVGTYINCIAEANGTYGFRTNTQLISMINCATYNNTSGRFQNASGGKQLIDLNPITGSGSFFTNAASNDFSLNNTAGAGALCRAAGFPTTAYPDTVSQTYLDVGAVQHRGFFARVLRLFEGYTIKFYNGKIILHQKQ